MSISDIYSYFKDKPKVAAASLLAAMLVGVIGASFYMKISEQRLAFLEEQIRQQAFITKRHKSFIDTLQIEMGELRGNIRTFSTSIIGVRKKLSSFAKDKQHGQVPLDEALLAVSQLEQDARDMEMAISRSEATTKAFSALLISYQLKKPYELSSFVRDLASLDSEQPNSSDLDAREFVDRIYRKSILDGAKDHIEGTLSPSNIDGLLKPGDVVYFSDKPKGAQNLGLYLGDETFVRSVSPKREIVVEKIKSDHWRRRLYEVRRLANSDQQQLAETYSISLRNEIDEK